MEDRPGNRIEDGSGESGSGGQWQDTIRLLKLVQSDYQGTRKQLDLVSQSLAEKEALVNQRLQHALFASGAYGTLRLLPFGPGRTGSLMGSAILGEAPVLAPLPDSMRLEVRCLGRFEVRSASGLVEHWQSVKAKLVFQYLMARPNEPVIKDVLMEALWPECDPQAAGNNLKAAVHGLRHTLARLFNKQDNFPYILFLQGSYRVNPQIELWVDVSEFERRFNRARRLEKEGRMGEAIAQYEIAEGLYRGDYLEDEPYEEWALLRREALKDTYLTILGKLADHALGNADYEACINCCQKVLAKDACREDAYRRLMCCYSRLGQRNRALRWFEICQRTILAGLDASPDPRTTALHERLLKNESL